MLQALAMLLFSAILLGMFTTIFVLMRSDWDAFTMALGLNRAVTSPAPLPPRYRVRPMRRASTLRFEAPEPRQRAAA